jgi:hypothetical protein
MNLRDQMKDDEQVFDASLRRLFNNWTEKQSPPRAIRRQVMRKAIAGHGYTNDLSSFSFRLRTFVKNNLLPVGPSDWDSVLYSRALLNSFEAELTSLRLVI